MTRIIETPVGFDFVLNGERHGTWRSKAEAKGGLAVEIERDRVQERTQMLAMADRHVAATAPGEGVE